MDSIKEYCNTSDEEGELHDITFPQYEKDTCRGFLEKSTKVDFFNLNKDEAEARINEDLTQEKGNDGSTNDAKSDTKIVTVKCGNETTVVHIPKSEFWNDVDPYIEVHHENNHRPNTKSNYITDEPVVCNKYRRQPNDIKRKYMCNSKEQFCEGIRYDYANHQQKKRTMNTIYSEGSVDIRNKSETERKLYYVHQMISPHLLERANAKFKYPRKLLKNIVAHEGVVNRIKWCVPMYSHLLGSVSMDGSMKVWNPWSTSDTSLRTVTCHTKAVKDMDWSSAGSEILTCSYDQTAAYSDVEKGLTLRIFDHPGFVLCGKHHHGNPNLIITGTTNQVLCWDVRDAEKPVKTFSHKDSFGQVQDVLLSRDGSQLFASTNVVSRDSADRNIICWDFSHGVVLSNQIYQERYMCTRMKLHPTENNFLAQSHGNYIAIFSTKHPYKMSRTKRFESHKLGGNGIGFDVSPDGSTVISGSCDGWLYAYNYHTGRLGHSLDTGHNISMDVCIHPVLYSTVAVCSWSGAISVWH